MHTWTDLEMQTSLIQLHFSDIEKISGLSPGTYVHMNGEPLGITIQGMKSCKQSCSAVNLNLRITVFQDMRLSRYLTIAESVNPQRVVPGIHLNLKNREQH